MKWFSNSLVKSAIPFFFLLVGEVVATSTTRFDRHACLFAWETLLDNWQHTLNLDSHATAAHAGPFTGTAANSRGNSGAWCVHFWMHLSCE